MNFKVFDIEIPKSRNLGFTISGNIKTHMRVANISQDGLAFKAGLKQNDYIMTMNGKKVNDRKDIMNSLNESKDKLTLKVIRYNDPESNNIIRTSRNNSKLARRSSVNIESLHHNLLSDLGSKIGMEISRSREPILNQMEKSDTIEQKFSTSDPRTKRINTLDRWNSTNLQSHNNEALENVGSKNVIELLKFKESMQKSIDMTDYKTVRRRTSDIHSLQQHVLPSQRDRKSVDLSRTYIPIKQSYELSRQVTPVALKCRKLSQNSFKATQDCFPSYNMSMASSTPSKTMLLNKIEKIERHEFSARVSSFRQKKTQIVQLPHYQSMSNISDFEKHISILSLNKNESCNKKHSTANVGSTVSLFEEDLPDSKIVEYKIDWRAIFEKISSQTKNEVETELINYFHNANIDLSIFPVNSLYRFITFDDVLEITFNKIISSEISVDFHEEMLNNPTMMIKVDYGMNSYDVTKLIKGDIKKFTQLIEEYDQRKNNHNQITKQLKETMSSLLKNSENTTKMNTQIDSICKKFESLNDILIDVVISMSMWKLSNDLPYLFYHHTFNKSTLPRNEAILNDFRNSQKTLEIQIIKLFQLFNHESYEEVLKLIDQIFSENLELSICLPIFRNKLLNDRKILRVLEDIPKILPGQEQFV